jgi:hypothetical protein
MRNLLRLLPLLVLAFTVLGAAPTRTPDAATLAALEAADAARVKAILAGDRAGLNASFSDDLYFVHASGKHDTKASYSEVLVTKQTVYASYTYKERHFRQISSDIVQMDGRVFVDTKGGILDLNFLALWRNENGVWRFLAWQSSRNNPPAPATK